MFCSDRKSYLELERIVACCLRLFCCLWCSLRFFLVARETSGFHVATNFDASEVTPAFVYSALFTPFYLYIPTTLGILDLVL